MDTAQDILIRTHATSSGSLSDLNGICAANWKWIVFFVGFLLTYQNGRSSALCTDYELSTVDEENPVNWLF